MDLHTPDYAELSHSLQLRHARVSKLADAGQALRTALSEPGPFLLEIDMLSIGSFKTAFAGPPVKTEAPAEATA